MQASSLRIAQSIVVCRAIIISQPMMELTKPKDFMPVEESQRYEWLLDDTREGMLEIQGGCGFSKKLLVTLNNITHCAAMLQEEPRNPSTPDSIKHQLEKLQSMKQWSRETGNFQDASEQSQHIEWIRQVAWEYRIKNTRDMTNVTAECWRIAAILYLQCRALRYVFFIAILTLSNTDPSHRLPRNHEDVLSNLDDLMRCIRIMPTSGACFTAQAPLFPVFLLGVLATQHHHQDISRQWFDLVVQAPVRSVSFNCLLYSHLVRANRCFPVSLECPTTLQSTEEHMVMDQGRHTPRQHGGVGVYWRALSLVGKARCPCSERGRGNTLPDMKERAGAQTAESQTKRERKKRKRKRKRPVDIRRQTTRSQILGSQVEGN
jgi:hypothetical protein